MIAGKSVVTKEKPVAVLGLLIIGNLLDGFWGLSGSVINGLGKSKFMLMMNIVSLALSLLLNWICIPIFGIAGAAISTVAYQIMQCIWMNLYLKKMGYWPYKKDLWVQGIWIVLLIVSDYVLNFIYEPALWIKIIAAVIIAGLILLTFWKQGLAGQKYGKKSE